METDLSRLTLNGRSVPPSMIGPLVEADMEGDLAEQLDQHGYLLVRGAHDPTDVEAARLEVLNRLAAVGEVSPPITAGRATGTSQRGEIYPTTADLGAFWRSVSEGPALRTVINGPHLTALLTRILGTPAVPFTFAWLRAMPAGRASPLHIDHPYMNRGSRRLLTCWTPLTDIALTDGTLYVLEGSHRWADLRAQFDGHDVDRDPSRPGHIIEDPVAMAQRHSSRCLTSAFRKGDCLIFGMFTAHGAFDNAATDGRIRLSCDTRFQPASDPMDDRFSGPNPPAHKGLGYGCLSAALPMTEAGRLR